MKFTNQQQKWALTTGLVLVLGFSFSMHFSPKAGPDYAQLGAAEEQIEPVMLAQNKELHVTHMSAELPPPPAQKEETKKTEANVFPVYVQRENEMQKIVFERSQDGKTKVTYPACKQVLKNINCPDGTCLKNVALINADLNSGISELVNVFSATYGKCEDTEGTTSASTSTKGTEVKETLASTGSASVASSETSEEEKHKAVFEKLKAKCDKLTKDSRLDCRIDGLTRLLTDTKVTYTKSVVLDFFKTQIEGPMKNELDSYNHMSPFAQHEYLQKTQELSAKIKEMQEEIREDYSYIREKVANMSIRAIAEKALEVNAYRQTGDVYSESAALNQLQILNGTLPASNKMGLMAAVSNNLINGRYASNIYNSVGNLGNNILNNISQISNMSPMAAELLLNSGLNGLDSWSYQRGVLNSLDVGPQLARLGDGTILLSDRLGLDRGLRRGSLDSIYDRDGMYGSRGHLLSSRSDFGRRRVLRGNGRFNDSGLYTNNFNYADNNRLGIRTNGVLTDRFYNTGVNTFGNFAPRATFNGGRGTVRGL